MSTQPMLAGRRSALVLAAALLGAAGPVLASCGGSGAGLIPAGQAGPLQSDFDAVARAAEKGNGNCAATEEAILKTESDFGALPGSVDAGLRRRIGEGITALRADALGICKQPLAGTTTGATTPKTTTTSTTTTTAPAITHTTSTPTQTSTTNTPTTGAGGGTPAPTPGSEGPSGAGAEQGGGAGGAPAGGGSPAGGSNSGAGGQEGAK